MAVRFMAGILAKERNDQVRGKCTRGCVRKQSDAGYTNPTRAKMESFPRLHVGLVSPLPYFTRGASCVVPFWR